MERPVFELSANARLLMARMERMAVGEDILYAELSLEIGAPVVGATPALQRAKYRLLMDRKYRFEVIIGKGLRRMTDEEITRAATRDRELSRNADKRAQRRLSAVQDYDAMPRQAQLTYTTEMSIFVAREYMSSDPGAQKVAILAAHGTAKELPIAQTIAAFQA